MSTVTVMGSVSDSANVSRDTTAEALTAVVASADVSQQQQQQQKLQQSRLQS